MWLSLVVGVILSLILGAVGWVMGRVTTPVPECLTGELLLPPQPPRSDRTAVYTPQTQVTHQLHMDQPQPLSIIVSYYNNPEGLLAHARLLALYSDRWKDYVEFIVVDDGSTEKPARKYLEQFYTLVGPDRRDWNITFVELSQDIGFNSGGAKNTGAQVAKFSRLLLLDMDVWVLPDKLVPFLHTRIPERQFMGRMTVSWMTSAGVGFPHNNVFFMNKEDYLRIGGYNEDFSGRYGMEDGEFLQRMLHHGYTLIREASWVCWLVNGVGVTSTKRPKATIMKEARENKKILRTIKRQGYPVPTSMARVPYTIVNTGK